MKGAEEDTFGYKLKDPRYDKVVFAFERLCHRYGLAVQSFFARRLPRWAVKSDEHKDLEQEVWTRLWAAVRSCAYDPSKKSVNKFLWGIAWNVLREWWRGLSKRPQPTEETRPPDTPSEDDGPDMDVESLELYQDFLDCLSYLAWKDNKVHKALVITLIEGKSQREAAEEISVAASTIHDWSSRGMMLIKECLAKKGWTKDDIGRFSA